jgi:hypothetical protein
MTVPMLLRWALQRDVPPPPQVVAENVQRRLGLRPERYPRPLRHAAWLAAHLGFGSTLGVAAQLWPLRAATTYGLAVWAANYGAALPALGIYPWPTRDRRARAAESLLSHLVFAAALRRAG